MAETLGLTEHSIVDRDYLLCLLQRLRYFRLVPVKDSGIADQPISRTVVAIFRDFFRQDSGISSGRTRK